VLTVAQVFELADRVGRRPFGNIRSHVQAERDQGDDDDDGPAGTLVPAG
jgi:hypothetical protein